jgi:N-acyl-D-aspartate/D-glutamate deacylase
MMVSTDAMPAFVPEQLSNPNIAGTFSLLLGEYVRDKGYLSLSDALSRISLKPAQWLQSIAPVFADKGRIQLGKDADIVIFDPATISANATYGDPYAPPTGMDWVIVNGEVVVDQGRLVVDRFPGERMIGVGQ